MTDLATLRLRITPTPTPLFGRNLRKAIGKYRWWKIRDAIVEEDGPVCEMCGARPEARTEIHGHEVWAYDTSASPAVARLCRITLHCWKCHGVEHYLLSAKLAAMGYVGQQRQIIEHFCAVNDVDEEVFDQHLSEAMAAWLPLCDVEWTVDYGDYANVLSVREAAQAKWRSDRERRQALR